MPREAELSLNEKEFILQALREEVRLDDRAFEDHRSLELTFGEDYGFADVSLGKTRYDITFQHSMCNTSHVPNETSLRTIHLTENRVTVRISCTVVAPLPDRKFDGILTISSEFFSPMTSPAYEAGRQTETETLLSRLLEKAVRRSGALDTESLCIVAGASCFAIRADLHVLRHDGNVLDASCVALMAALSHFRRPDFAVEPGNGRGGSDGAGNSGITIFDPREREPIPLAMLHIPLYVSFSLVDGGETVLVDATAAEEQIRQGEIVIAMNRQGELCQMAKYGGAPTDAMLVLKCCGLAREKVRMLTEVINKKLEVDKQKRNVGDLIAELSAENKR